MSGSSGSSSSTSSTVPWKGQQPYLKEIFSEAQKLYRGGPLEYYGGQAIAGFGPLDAAARQRGFAAADWYIPQALDAGAYGLDYGLRQAVDVGQNPVVQGAIEAAMRAPTRSLRDEWLPAIRNQSIATGNVGSSRQGIAEGLAIARADENARDASSRIMADAYSQGLLAQGRALSQIPAFAQASMMPSGIYSSFAEQDRDYEQALLNEARAKFEFEQQEPWGRLMQYLQAVQGNYGGSTTVKTETPQAPWWQRVIGGGLAGAANGGMWGAGAGALLGLLG